MKYKTVSYHNCIVRQGPVSLLIYERNRALSYNTIVIRNCFIFHRFIEFELGSYDSKNPRMASLRDQEIATPKISLEEGQQQLPRRLLNIECFQLFGPSKDALFESTPTLPNSFRPNLFLENFATNCRLRKYCYFFLDVMYAYIYVQFYHWVIWLKYV